MGFGFAGVLLVAALAQLVERWIVAPKVTGSKPVCRPTTLKIAGAAHAGDAG